MAEGCDISNSSNGTDLDYWSFSSRKRGTVAFGLHLHNNVGIPRFLHFLSSSGLHKPVRDEVSKWTASKWQKITTKNHEVRMSSSVYLSNNSLILARFLFLFYSDEYYGTIKSNVCEKYKISRIHRQSSGCQEHFHVDYKDKQLETSI